MKSKNIWIINQYTGSPYHGMNYRSYYLAKEFIKKGYKITIFSGSYSHLFTKIPNTNGIFTNENIDGIEYIWVKTPKYKTSKSIGRFFNMLVFMFNLFFFNVSKLKKPDHIIISSLSIFPVLNAYLWAKKFKIDFTFEVRDIWPLTLIHMGNLKENHFLVKFIGWFEKFGYKNAKYVVSVLNNADKHMIKKGMDLVKFKYIPNGIYIDEKQYISLDSKVNDSIPKNKFIVGYAGTIGIANALEYLIDTAILLKDNNDICFVIVGNGGEKENLLRKVKNESLTNVLFIDAIPKDQVNELLKLFDVCYLGWHNYSLYEYGISANKLFDYMYSGRPILHSFLSEDNIVQDANCGITVETENPELIKNAILEFYKMTKEELTKMGHNGKEYVLNNHSYEYLAKKYEELF